MARMQTLAPTRKVTAAGGGSAVSGAVTTLAVYLIERYGGEPLPTAVVIALGTLLATLGALTAGYFISPSPDDRVVGG